VEVLEPVQDYRFWLILRGEVGWSYPDTIRREGAAVAGRAAGARGRHTAECSSLDRAGARGSEE